MVEQAVKHRLTLTTIQNQFQQTMHELAESMETQISSHVDKKYQLFMKPGQYESVLWESLSKL